MYEAKAYLLPAGNIKLLPAKDLVVLPFGGFEDRENSDLTHENVLYTR